MLTWLLNYSELLDETGYYMLSLVSIDLSGKYLQLLLEVYM